MKHGNCLIYAIRKWIKEGGYLVIRRSHASKIIPHFLHLDDSACFDKQCLSQFAPDYPKSTWQKFVHKLWFKGTVKRGDD